MVLESKSGNWKYLPHRWTQIPRENKSMNIEEAGNRKVLGINETTNMVELQTKDNSSVTQKWKKSKTMNGFFTLHQETNSQQYLTVDDKNSDTLVIQSK